VEYAISIIGGYLLGSIPFGLVLTRIAGLGDIRDIGSGNIGATNVLRTGRKDIAAATLFLDAAKAAIALLIIKKLFGPDFGFIAGASAFMGHCFPVWLKFNGGKGVATFFGTLLIGFWPVGVISGLIWLGMAYIFRYSSLAALVAAVLAPFFAALFHQSPIIIGAIAFMTILILIRHHENISRLLKGQETKIGDKKK
jgi:acyl phosphate:glycerol-3-phosphate acyltransferase